MANPKPYHEPGSMLISGEFGIIDLIEEMNEQLIDEIGSAIVEAEDEATWRLRSDVQGDERWSGLESRVYVEVDHGVVSITHDDDDDVRAAEYGTQEDPPSGLLRKYIEPVTNEVTVSVTEGLIKGVPLA